MSITYIYGIWDLEIDGFIYVGKANEPKSRFRSHVRNSNIKYLRKRIQEKSRGCFELEVLERVEFEVPRGWVEQEKFWIKKLREEGHSLLNKNDGGGGPTAGYRHTEETKAKQSKVKMGENNPRGFLGKHHSEETIAKISKTLMGHEVTEETIAKIRKGNLGREVAEETRVKLSKAAAKPYPAFYNTKTGEQIPIGKNLTKLCREQNLSYDVLYRLKSGHAKQSRDGWRLNT